MKKAIQSGTFYKKTIEIEERRLIVTIAKGDFFEKLAKITHPLMKRYADKCEAEFLVLTEGKEYFKEFPHYAKCEIGSRLLNDYDRILYIDTDIIIRPDSPNLFEIVPLDCLALFNEGKYTERTVGFSEYMKAKGHDPVHWNKKYYNTGVFLCSKMHKEIFDYPVLDEAKGEKPDQHFFEQSYFNLMIHFHSPKMFELGYDFNRMTCIEPFCGKSRLGSFFVHYAGLSYQFGEKFYFELMQKDIKEWEDFYNSTPAVLDIPWKHNIMLQCNGGLGDIIDAEPVARYIINTAYKNSNVVIVTHTKEVFDHLGVPVLFGSERLPEDFHPWVKLETLPAITTEFYHHVSPMMINPTDMMALQALKRVLPLSERRIKLSFSELNMGELRMKLVEAGDFYLAHVKELFLGKYLRNTVVMHVGRGWPSKTIPSYIWKSYIDELVNKGYGIILIGKRVNDFNRHVELEIDSPSVLDLRDKLPLKELFALISMTACFLTNDSGPLHVMGAYDGFLGVFATCKDAEYILPYREESNIFWRAENLCKKKLWEDYSGLPTNIDGAQVDACTEERIVGVCPSPEEVWNFVNYSFEDLARASGK